MTNFFADDQEEPFLDRPEETNLDASGKPMEAPPVNVKVQRPVGPKPTPPPAVQAPIATQNEEVAADEDDEDYSSVLNDARIRLEQGRLYEMIMNNDLFEGTEADPKAVKSVQKQIRNFAKEQMEIMLGMRQEPSQKEALLAENFPFNDLEVEALKALASAATKGATQAPEAQTFSGAQAPVARQGLKPITLKSKSAPIKAQAPQKPLASKPATPVVRKKNDAVVEQILAEEGITKEEFESTFDPNYKPLEKPLHKMTEQEIIDRNRQAKKRIVAPAKNEAKLPMPSPDQEEAMYAQRANQAASHPQMQAIMKLVIAKQQT